VWEGEGERRVEGGVVWGVGFVGGMRARRGGIFFFLVCGGGGVECYGNERIWFGV